MLLQVRPSALPLSRRTGSTRPARGLVSCSASTVAERPANVEVLSGLPRSHIKEFEAYAQASRRIGESQQLLNNLEATLQRMDEADRLQQVAPLTPKETLQEREARARLRAAKRKQRQAVTAVPQSAPTAAPLHQHEAILDAALGEVSDAKQRLQRLFNSTPAPVAVPSTKPARQRAADAPSAFSGQQQAHASVSGAAVSSAAGPLDFERMGITSLLPAGPSLPASARDVSSRRNRMSARGQTQAAAKGSTAGGANDSMAMFLKQASNSNLLDSQMEKDLALMVKDYIFLQRASWQLKGTLKREPTTDEWAAVVGMDTERFVSRLTLAQEAKTMLMQSNYRLVVSIVKKYRNKGMSIQDLVTEGMHGLLKGVEKYDPTKGFRFSTYAHWWIRQAVTRGLADQSRTVRLPSHIMEGLAKLTAVREELKRELQRDPTPAEVEVRSGIPHKKAEEWIQLSHQPTSLESQVNEGDSASEMKDMLVDERMMPDEVMSEMMMSRDLDEVLEGLNEREAGVIKLRFGLMGEGVMTLEEIGEQFQVTRERIRQIEAKAFRKLKARAGELEAMLRQYAAHGNHELAGRNSRGTKKT